MRRAVLPVVVCHESVKKRRLSIDSNGTVDMILPFENSEDDSPQGLTMRKKAPTCTSMNPRVSAKQKRESRGKKEKARKRASISSEGTIIEDLGLSGGQSLSENMQQQENGDFSGKNEYATANAREILQKKNETCKDNLKEEKIGIQYYEDLLPDRIPRNMQASDSFGENRIQTTSACKSSCAELEDTNMLISILEDELTSLQKR